MYRKSSSWWLTALAGGCAALLAATAPSSANPNAINPIPVLNGSAGLPQLPPGPTRAVFQATGMGSPNGTQVYNVLGTDLGIMWDDGHGRMLTAFGDTAGAGLPNMLSGSLWAWRSNILVRSPIPNPAHGIYYTSVARDIFGQAKELIRSPKIPFVEISRIPTAGVSVHGVQYMSTMSVRNWEADGRWNTNYSNIVVSGDDGENWLDLHHTRRPNSGGNHNFQMNALLKSGGFVYEYGTPPGRHNLGYVARVPAGAITDLGAYEYWTGRGWKRGDVNAAAPIVSGVSEISVAWNNYLGSYLMLTTDPMNSVVMRAAPSPQGPWGPPIVLIDTRALPTAYAPMIFPYQTGRELYFLTTIHSQYNVVLMRTTL